jgi:MtaA/CmuA family methyltransferase
MNMNSKERCLAAIHGQEVDKVPVFPLLMAFSADRLGINYRQFASSGKALAESQLKVREEFAIDAITSCSDAFRLSADLGGDIVFPETKPPYITDPIIENESDLKELVKSDVTDHEGRMWDRVEGTREMVKNARDECLVLGWVDMPFAEACSVCGVSNFMLMLNDNPELAHNILNFLTEIVIDFSLAQIETGAPMIGAGDAAASLISPEYYREFALPYEQRICQAVHKAGGMVKLHICGNTTKLLDDMARSGADLYNVDHVVDLSVASEVFDEADKCFKGNIDPVEDMLQATPDECEKRSLECIEIGAGKRYMLSAGCEVPAAVSDDVFHAFCQAPEKV